MSVKTTPQVSAFIQARMSSVRFPGKVLAPFQGRPLIVHVVTQVNSILPMDRIVVATSGERSDDPLVCYAQSLGLAVFRGSLNNVVERFQGCLKEHSCDWFFRICADSPLLDSSLLEKMLVFAAKEDLDLVTNVFPRTFPKGQSLEMLRSSTFAQLESEALSLDEREHATQIYYTHPERFRILNVVCEEPGRSTQSLAIDTPEDLRRLEPSSSFSS